MRISHSTAVPIFILLSTHLTDAADRLIHMADTSDVIAFDLPDPTPFVLLPGQLVGGAAACSTDGYFFSVGRDAGNREFVLLRWDRSGGSATSTRLPDPDLLPSSMAFGFNGDLYMGTAVHDFSVGVYRLPGANPSLPPQRWIPPFTRFHHGSTTILAGPHAGALLLVDNDNAQVWISEPPGSAPRVFIPGSAFPRFSGTHSVASDPCGQIFVGYYSGPDSVIARFDVEGRFLDNFHVSSPVATGQWIVFDSEGNLFSSDVNGPILKIAPDRTVTEFFPRGRFSTGIFTICQDPLQCSTGGSRTVECTGGRTCLSLASAPQHPCMDFTWTSNCPGADFGGTERSASPTLCFDATACNLSCKVDLALKEGLRSATCSSEIVVQDTVAPRLSPVPPMLSAECDAVPPPPTVIAVDDCDPTPRLGFREDRIPGRCPGEYALDRRWTAVDDCSNSSQADQTVTVHDTEPPEVAGNGDDLYCLWPPNHRMVCFDRSDVAPSISDACSDPVAWRFQGCASDQPEDADGDGHTSPDCLVSSDGASFCVRAERAGGGLRAQAGRRYHIAIVATDACGNESAPVEIGRIHVPHDGAPGTEACLRR